MTISRRSLLAVAAALGAVSGRAQDRPVLKEGVLTDLPTTITMSPARPRSSVRSRRWRASTRTRLLGITVSSMATTASGRRQPDRSSRPTLPEPYMMPDLTARKVAQPVMAGQIEPRRNRSHPFRLVWYQQPSHAATPACSARYSASGHGADVLRHEHHLPPVLRLRWRR